MAAGLAGMAFVPYFNHLMKLLDTNSDLKKSAKGIMKQVGYGAAGTVAGGFVGGPLGALVGGVAGSLYGYSVSDDYTAMLTVIRNLTDAEKRELVERVQELVGTTGLEALTTFIGMQINREILLNLVKTFAENSKGG